MKYCKIQDYFSENDNLFLKIVKIKLRKNEFFEINVFAFGNIKFAINFFSLTF